MQIPILGGPFDGATLEVPRRTPVGLRLHLESEGALGEYRLCAHSNGRMAAIFRPAEAGGPPVPARAWWPRVRPRSRARSPR